MSNEPSWNEDGGAHAPPSFTSGSRARTLRAAGVALLILGIVLGGLALAGIFSSGDDGLPAATGAGAEMTAHKNRKGGYSFAYPPEWKLKDRGATSTITAPGSAQIVSFGPAPEGSLRESSRRFLATIIESYDDPALAGAELRQLDGHQALMVAGEARNRAGVSLRFLTVTIAGDRANYGIVVYTDVGSDPVETLPIMERIVGSFHIEP